ncbi:MAG: T9SS type A sorting domain-containing protein [Bacteroidales bacterium]|nr:T9SS type A sorting domain-containing protein [Bacteroidales bacterium]
MLEVTEAGLYWVTVTDGNGCSASDSVYVDAGTSTEGRVILPGQVRIFPNPAKDVLHVEFDLDVERAVTLELYSIVNALIYREDIKRARVTEAEIDVQGMIPGTYYLRIITDDVPHNFLVIVE